MTTSLLSSEQLRQQIRIRLAQGRLPVVDGIYKTHRGTGRPCIVCRRSIERPDVEYELVGVALIAHEACHRLWWEESVSRQAASRL